MVPHDDDSNRRTVFKGAVAAGVGFAPVPGFAQGAKAMDDPTTRFPTEPFPEQKQDWPALQRNMRPDCREASYRGSGSLKGRKALVIGGDSGIGRAAAIAFAREGADVAINYFPTEEPDAQDVAKLLRSEGRKVFLIPGDLTDAEFCTSLVAKAGKDLGGFDIVVNNAAYLFQR
jgi:short chain dehydrogenase